MIGMVRCAIMGAAVMLVVATLPALAATDTASDWKCTAITEVPIDERIVACTSVLESGKYGQQGAIRAHFNRAAAYNKKREFAHAIADYDELIRLYPRNMYAYYSRAYSYHQLGEFDRAIADYGEAIRLNPKNQRAYFSRGVTYSKNGDYDRAIADYTDAIQFSSQGPQADANGAAYYQGNDLAPVVADRNQASPANSTTRRAYVARGAAYIKKGSIDRAISDYDQAIGLDPSEKTAFVYRAAAYRAEHELNRAMADCERAVQLDPKDEFAYICRGATHMASADPGRAIAEFDRAIELNPKQGGAYRDRAMANFRTGSIAKSIADLDQASSLDPKNPYIALWRDIISRRGNQPGRLADAASQVDMAKWPAPVIRLFLGEVTPKELLAAADDQDPVKKKGQECEANFYTAELALQRGTMEEARRLFGLAVADCPKTFIEWQAAQAELSALDAKR
ncbi:tetratricopeptide repeat protein [Bradyrhizobium sp. UFLA05-109]